MLYDVTSLCGTYSRPKSSEADARAIKYLISLDEKKGQKVLLTRTDYGDGRSATEEIPFDEIEDPESRISLMLRVLDRLKTQWTFIPDFPLEAPASSDYASEETPNDEDDINEPYFDQAFFPIRSSESYLKYELEGFTRKLLSEHEFSADEIRKLSILMLGLERLPRITPGLDVRLDIILREGGNSNYSDLELTESRLAISSGGYVYNPEFGGDSFSSTLFECESTGFRDGSIDSWELGSWLLSAHELLNLGATVEVSDDSDENLEWEIEFEQEPFEELEARISRWNQYLDEG